MSTPWQNSQRPLLATKKQSGISRTRTFLVWCKYSKLNFDHHYDYDWLALKYQSDCSTLILIHLKVKMTTTWHHIWSDGFDLICFILLHHLPVPTSFSFSPISQILPELQLCVLYFQDRTGQNRTVEVMLNVT